MGALHNGHRITWVTMGCDQTVSWPVRESEDHTSRTGSHWGIKVMADGYAVIRLYHDDMTNYLDETGKFNMTRIVEGPFASHALARIDVLRRARFMQ